MDRFARRGAEVHEVAAVGYARTFERLQVGDGPGASRLGLALALVEFPSCWCRSTGGLFDVGVELTDGLLSAALERGLASAGLLAGARPRWFGQAIGMEHEDPLPPRAADAHPLLEDDLRLVDDLFQVHLPTLIAQERGLDPRECVRPSQHEVARAVAEVLGTQELLRSAANRDGQDANYLPPPSSGRTRGVRVGLAIHARLRSRPWIESARSPWRAGWTGLPRGGPEGSRTTSLARLASRARQTDNPSAGSPDDLPARASEPRATDGPAGAHAADAPGPIAASCCA